ncbi:MAG: alpha-ketoglutarate-dependent dioxygenase AlkB [Gammaproteobacteria bacterium]
MPTATSQLPLAFSTAAERENPWFGTTLDHRELFAGLQSEWLPNRDGQPTRLLGVSLFPPMDPIVTDRNLIPVHLRLDPRLMPHVHVLARRGEAWEEIPTAQVGSQHDLIAWPGALPLFAVVNAEVASEEERARLVGLARQVSNVPLPPVVVRATVEPDAAAPAVAVPEWRGEEHAVCLPADYDQTRGAAAMAWWGVPRVDPWLDLLCASFGTDEALLRSRAEAVDATWWTGAPWSLDLPVQPGASYSENLWQAALRVIRASISGPSRGASDLAAAILAEASRDRSKEEIRRLERWEEDTRRVVRADSPISPDTWQHDPVGSAVQLALTRPEPDNFRRWFDELPTIPPSVWWSAAALCGLLCGYRRLGTTFRGDAELRRLLAMHALGCPAVRGGEAIPPRWQRRDGAIVCNWGGAEVLRRPEHNRGRWFHADFASDIVTAAAEDLARRDAWPCFRQEIVLADCRIDVAGAGRVSTKRGKSAALQVLGEVRLQFPSNATIRETLDVSAFRHCIVTAGGVHIPPPPASLPPREPPVPHPDVPGLFCVRDIVTEGEEISLVAEIDRSPWLTDLKRRVQHYGWRYGYKDRKVTADMRLGPLPRWADEIAERLFSQGFVSLRPDQVIVNEYMANQGISRHVDCPACFEDGVAMISLLESWEMVFRPRNGNRKVAVLLERRSLAVMTGKSRYEWSHEIPARNAEPGGLRRERRISITFRRVRIDASSSRDSR